MTQRIIFYLIFVSTFLVATFLFNPTSSLDFISSFSLWKISLAGSSLAGLLGALLGTYILLHRMPFLSLTLSHSSGLGIFLGFMVLPLLGFSGDEPFLLLMFGFLTSLTALGLFTYLKNKKGMQSETLLAFIFIFSSGGMILAGNFIPQGHHEMENRLFGNAVSLAPDFFIILLITSLIIFLIHRFFRKQFLFISADPDFMKIRGFQTKGWMFLLFTTLLAGITLSVMTLGSLPTFALMTIPSFIASKNAKNIKETFTIAVFLGTIIPILGYFFSYVFDFPTGASLALTSGVFLILSGLEKRIFRK